MFDYIVDAQYDGKTIIEYKAHIYQLLHIGRRPRGRGSYTGYPTFLLQ